jgi:hypothetical protein
VLYKTHESDNGLKLAQIAKGGRDAVEDGVPLVHTLDSAKQFHKVSRPADTLSLKSPGNPHTPRVAPDPPPHHHHPRFCTTPSTWITS